MKYLIWYIWVALYIMTQTLYGVRICYADVVGFSQEDAGSGWLFMLWKFMKYLIYNIYMICYIWNTSYVTMMYYADVAVLSREVAVLSREVAGSGWLFILWHAVCTLYIMTCSMYSLYYDLLKHIIYATLYIVCFSKYCICMLKKKNLLYIL